MRPNRARALGVLQQRLMQRQPRLDHAAWAVRMRPHAAVSGDLVMIWEGAGNGSLNAFIGDVEGHGADAGFVAVALMAALHSQNLGNCAEGLKDLNTLLYEDSAHMPLCTGLLLNLRKDGFLCVASAGHIPLLWMHGDGTVDTLPAEHGPPLGAFRDVPELSCTPAQMQPGDRLLLLTDGLLERRHTGSSTLVLPNPVREAVFRAAGTDSLQEDVDTLWSMLTAMVGPSTPEDDQTMLLIEYSGSVAANGASE